MNLTVKSPVWDDLREIGSRIAQDNPEAAERFFTAAEEAFETLRQQPGLGRLRSFSLAGIRSWVIPSFQNYIVFYLPTKTEVQVLAVLHGARDVPTVIAGRLP
jgi:toxin ParE1/3/4